MRTEDISSEALETESFFTYDISKKIVGNMIILLPNELNVQKKLNKIENEFKAHIISKNQHFHQDLISIFMVFEGTLQEFQKIVVEVNGIKELKNFRYIIIK